ncbi:MAG: lipopolysaccharide core heptose(I) kinase RfaP [Methylotenera sp.]
MDVFEALMQLQGKVFRDVADRKTMQVQIAGKNYFLKQHFGVGWGEIFKNLLSFKTPVIGAMTEVEAIQQLTALGVATTPLVAYGARGLNPATRRSFVLTQDLGDIVSLEDVCADWAQQPPAPEFKARIVIAMAELAARMHAAGLCHRDFYLCHLVMQRAEFKKGLVRLMVIDLHRMLRHQSSGGASVMKDIAGLMFSAMDSGFDEQDWALFKRHYLPQSAAFWKKAYARAQRLHAKFHSSKFQQRLAQEKAAVDD